MVGFLSAKIKLPDNNNRQNNLIDSFYPINGLLVSLNRSIIILESRRFSPRIFIYFSRLGNRTFEIGSFFFIKDPCKG